jgi:hypothetical protein
MLHASLPTETQQALFFLFPHPDLAEICFFDKMNTSRIHDYPYTDIAFVV